MSSKLIELLDELVDDIYGDVPKLVFHFCCKYPSAKLSDLIKSTRTHHKAVKAALALLVQEGLVKAWYLEDPGLTRYSADPTRAYNLLRTGKYLDIVEQRLSNSEIVAPLTNLLTLGRADRKHISIEEEQDGLWEQLTGLANAPQNRAEDDYDDLYIRPIRNYDNLVEADLENILTEKIIAEDPTTFKPPIRGPVKEAKFAQALSGKKILARNGVYILDDPYESLIASSETAQRPPNALDPPEKTKLPNLDHALTQAYLRPIKPTVQEFRDTKTHAHDAYDRADDPVYSQIKRSHKDVMKNYAVEGKDPHQAMVESREQKRDSARQIFLEHYNMAAEYQFDHNQSPHDDMKAKDFEAARKNLIASNKKRKAQFDKDLRARKRRYAKPAGHQSNGARIVKVGEQPNDSGDPLCNVFGAAWQYGKKLEGRDAKWTKPDRLDEVIHIHDDEEPEDDNTSNSAHSTDAVEDGPMAYDTPLTNESGSVVDGDHSNGGSAPQVNGLKRKAEGDDRHETTTSKKPKGSPHTESDHAKVPEVSDVTPILADSTDGVEGRKDKSGGLTNGTELVNAKPQSKDPNVRQDLDGQDQDKDKEESLFVQQDEEDEEPVQAARRIQSSTFGKRRKLEEIFSSDEEDLPAHKRARRKKGKRRSDLDIQKSSFFNQSRNYLPSVAAHTMLHNKRQRVEGYTDDMDLSRIYWNPEIEDDLHQHDFSQQKVDDLYVMDQEKLTVRLRSDALADLVLYHFGPIVAHVYLACLRYLEQRIDRCYDPYEQPVTPTTDLATQSGSEEPDRSSQGRPRPDDAQLARLKDDPSFQQDDIMNFIDMDLNLRDFVTNTKPDTTTQLEVSKEDEAVPSERNQDEPLDEDLRKEAVENILNLLTNTPHTYSPPAHSGPNSHFLVALPKSRGATQLYKVDFHVLSAKLVEHEICSYVTDSISLLAARCIRALKHQGKLEERHVSMATLTAPKKVNEALFALSTRSFIEIQEIPRDNRKGGPKEMMYLFSYEQERARHNVIEDCYQAMSRLLHRLKYERGLVKDLLDKAERLENAQEDVEGSELQKKTHKNERRELAKFRRKENIIWTEIGRLDDVVLKLRDFLPLKEDE